MLRRKYRAKEGTRKTSRNNTNCEFIPRSVKAWTEVSPNMPLRVKKVEYNTNMKERI